VLGEPHEVVVERLLGIRRHLDRGRLLVGEVHEHVAAQVVEPLVGEAEAAGGEERVAAALRLRRLLQHQHARPLLAGRQRRAERRVPTADDDDVVPLVHHDPLRIASAGGTRRMRAVA
jgi:hypothetical protein